MKYSDYQPQEPKRKRTARLKQCNKSNRLARRYWAKKLGKTP